MHLDLPGGSRHLKKGHDVLGALRDFTRFLETGRILLKEIRVDASPYPGKIHPPGP